MKKKILFITSMIVAFALFVPNVMAVTVKTEEEFYTQLANGKDVEITKALSIKLENDLNLTTTVTVGASSGSEIPVTFDLNGHKIQVSGGGYFYVQTKGKLIINDSVGTGLITNTGTANSNGIIYVKGNCEMNGGTIENTLSSKALYIQNGDNNGLTATFTLNGGTILNSNDRSGQAVSVGSRAIFIMNGGKVKSLAGNYQGDLPAIKGGDIRITGGTIEVAAEARIHPNTNELTEADGMAIESSSKTVEITGGTIITDGYALKTKYVVVEPAEGKTVNISSGMAILRPYSAPSEGKGNQLLGGNFEAPILSSGSDSSNVELYGGTYSSDVTNYVAEGHVTKIVDGKYVVVAENDVNVSSVNNGKIVVDKVKAIAGETVTVTVTPNEEYKLVSIKVLDANNKEVTVKDGKFTMPNSEVTVSAELTQIKYKVNIATVTGGTVAVDKTEVTKGETVTVTIAIAEGYELSTIKVLDADNKEVAITNNTFVMPNSEVTVTAAFKKLETIVSLPVVDTTEEVEEVVVGVQEFEVAEEVLLESLEEILKEEGNEELAEVLAKENTVVEVEIETVDTEKVEETIVKEMEKVAGKAKITTYFDITVAVRNDEKELLGTVSELTKEIELVVLLPEELKNTDKLVNRTYYVIRQHEDKVEKLPATLSKDGNHLVFKSDKFSTYALAYEDTENPGTFDGISMYLVIGLRRAKHAPA